MKIQTSEFKKMIKECLKELISEGALNNSISQVIRTQGIPVNYNNNNGMQPNYYQPQMVNPNVAALTQTARTQQEAQLYENIYGDALNTMNNQVGNDPQYMMQNGMMNQHQFPVNNGYYNNNGYNMQQPMMPQGYANNNGYQPNNQMVDQGSGGSMTKWARLAFNSPIKNRPSNEGPLSGMGNGALPGNNSRNFG